MSEKYFPYNIKITTMSKLKADTLLSKDASIYKLLSENTIKVTYGKVGLDFWEGDLLKFIISRSFPEILILIAFFEL